MTTKARIIQHVLTPWPWKINWQFLYFCTRKCSAFCRPHSKGLIIRRIYEPSHYEARFDPTCECISRLNNNLNNFWQSKVRKRREHISYCDVANFRPAGSPRGIDVHLNLSWPIGMKWAIEFNQSEQGLCGGLFEAWTTQTASRFTTIKKVCEFQGCFWISGSGFLRISSRMTDAYFFR